MPLEDDIDSFRMWATKLGCPQDSMPSEEALKSVFKSRQRDLFCNMMRRVRPQDEVKAIEENILIHKLQKIKGQIIAPSERLFLPNKMQRYFKVEDLKTKNKDLNQRLSEHKKEYGALAASIKSKNIQLINMENKCNLLEAKVHILDFKAKSLEQGLQNEETIKQRIEATTPVVLNNETKSETNAQEAVVKALSELENFYAICENNTNQQILQQAQNLLWTNMRKIFKNIPNFLIFNNIMRIKEEQLQHIMSLNKTCSNDSSYSMSNQREPFSNFEINLLKTKANILGLVAKYISARQERKSLEEQFIKTYADFEEKFLEKVKMFNVDYKEDYSEDVIREYIIQYNQMNFIKGDNEFLSHQIESLKGEIENSTKFLENHEVLLGSIKQVYTEISNSVNRIRYDFNQMPQIKDKIIYSKNIMKHQLNDLNNNTANSNFLTIKPKNMNNNNISPSFLSVDSFELNTDNVFSSTKYDFESTTNISMNNTTLRGCDVTLMPQAQNTVLPTHQLELNTFNDLPLEQLSCVTKECSFHLSPNPLIVESRELSSTIQLAPGVLLTPFGALQEVRNHILWADIIAKHSNDLKLNLDVSVVDPQVFKQQAKQQHDRIIETLDSIDVCSLNTLHSLQKLARFYDFLIENPLGQFIPATKQFNNQTFAEYEAEHQMYVRMATTGNSIK